MSEDDWILLQLRRRGPLSTGELAAELGVSRQAAHRRLQRMAGAGLVMARGAGRASRWELARRSRSFRFRTAGLAEDRVWDELLRQVPELPRLEPDARAIASYALTEMVNNAIEHSGSRTIDVLVERLPDAFAFEVIDRGVGAYESVRAKLGLETALDALGEISKGKTTTMPERHSGEGIFFTSKAVRRFLLEANRTAWLVDKAREDMSVAPSHRDRGTRVRFEVPLRPSRKLADVFAEFTDEYEFSRTRTVVRLFTRGTDFVSRSEARRLMSGLERFREVVLDFEGVASVGQGFCDEIFRVWGTAHPEVRLTVERAAPEVAFMIARSQRAGGSSGRA